MSIGYFDLGKQLTDVSSAQRLGATIEFAERADRQGVARYWIAEHHGPGVPLAAPELALAVIASRTRRLRLGPAGVLLRYYHPFKVAETYLTLSLAFGPRFDLGVCRGPGVGNDEVAHRLVGGNALELTDQSFEDKAVELVSLIRDPPTEPARAPGPHGAPAPEPWILGSGRGSANLALKVGAPYGYMCFYPDSEEWGTRLLHAYQSSSTRDRGLIAVSVMCAGTERAARTLETQSVSWGCFPSNVVGTPKSCISQLGELAERYQTSDMVIATFSPRKHDHLATIELAGEANLDPELARAAPNATTVDSVFVEVAPPQSDQGLAESG